MNSPPIIPAALGYHMPAEWELHEATWLTWPHDEAHWPGKFAPIPAIWARMVKELETGEDVHLCIHDDATEQSAKEAMAKAGVLGERVHLHRIPNNFSWARDHGPIFVRNAAGELLITHWRYNAWGGKWEHDLDVRIPTRVSEITGIPEVQVPMVLEGGSIDVNGKGCLLTTEACLLHKNRNPSLTKEQIEEHLRQYLGITKILWLGDGIAGDDTDGHVDDLTRFVGPRSLVTVVEEDSDDPNFTVLQENLHRLHSMTDQDGQPFEIHELPLPSPVLYEGEMLPASYANFYIGNSVVLLPIYNDPNDRKAIDTLQKAFPDRKIVPIDGTDLIWGLGSFHCVTQQQPRRQHSIN